MSENADYGVFLFRDSEARYYLDPNEWSVRVKLDVSLSKFALNISTGYVCRDSGWTTQNYVPKERQILCGGISVYTKETGEYTWTVDKRFKPLNVKSLSDLMRQLKETWAAIAEERKIVRYFYEERVRRLLRFHASQLEGSQKIVEFYQGQVDLANKMLAAEDIVAAFNEGSEQLCTRSPFGGFT